ncbi:hypothetical protein [Methylibium sp.]|uniref:hypothetical protein n=1 Tax=Methylibium sp. TaxID=2067992 RepID=UPI003D100B92
MPNRFARSQVILAKKEVTYGLDPTPTGAANAILASNINLVPLQANNVDRNLVRPYFGASEQLINTRLMQLSYDVELAGSGTVGAVPAWSALIQACAFAETIDADYVAYAPVTDNQASVCQYINDSGVLHVMLGARGTVVCKMNAGEMPVMSYTFTGLYGAPSASALPTPVYTGFRTPQIPNDAQTLDLVLGGALTLATIPAITGGTALPSLGLEIDVGNEVPLTPLIGGETVDVTNRNVSGRLRVDQTPAQEVARLATILGAGLTSVGIQHGTVTGEKVLLWLPTAQFQNPTKEELNGRRLQGYSLRGVPSAGNDEFRIVTSF